MKKTPRKKTKKTKEELLNEVLGDLFCVITDHDAWDRTELELKKVYVVEAKMIEQTKVWHWLLDEMRIAAEKKMFDEAKSFEDMQGGKFMLYTLDVLKKKIENLSKLAR